MDLEDYRKYDAVGLAELVRKKEVSATELLEAAIAQCERINPKLNAVVYRCDAAARDAAGHPIEDAPFAGVPFLVKDLGPTFAGAPHTSGSRLFAQYIPAVDGTIVARFKQAGFITFGKTNTPEFGIVPVTEGEHLGVCHNPWDLSRTPGGSSGGAAAAVAAGIVPMAHASDGGGSIRIPASCCGLFGLKPSRGLNPGPDRITITHDFVTDHAVSRTVRDSAAMLDAVSSRQGFLAELEAQPKGLKIAVARSAMLGSTVHPDVKKALDEAAKLMAALGHEVVEAEPSLDYGEAARAFLTFWAAGAAEALDAATDMIGRKATAADVELPTWTLGLVGQAMTADDISSARHVMKQVADTFGDFLNRHDIIMTPTLAAPPLKIGEGQATALERFAMRAAGVINTPRLLKALLREVASKSFAFAAFTGLFNMSGQPAMSLPLGQSAEGLPIGIQFAAKHGADGLLLRLARQVELARPWAGHYPELS